jgi:hypothetical protein
MKTDHWLMVLAICLLQSLSVISAVPPVGAPTSGIITYSNSIITFDGVNTRHQTHGRGEILTLRVTGDEYWVAFPISGRLMTNRPAAYQAQSFPEQTRQYFNRMKANTNATELAATVYNGWPCWQYTLKDTRFNDDGTKGETTIWTNLYLANPDFPLLVCTAHGSASPQGVLDIQWNPPVPRKLFLCPTNLKIAQPFRVPKEPFQIEIRQIRSSPKYGWTVESTNEITCDGSVIKNRFTQTSHNPNGASVFGPKVETNSFQQGILAFNYPMSAPFWLSVRKIGSTNLLGLKAGIYQATVMPRTYWVVDHPQLGTFSARWAMGGDTPETNEVTRLKFP